MPVVGECEGGLTLHFRVMADLLLVVTLGGRGLPGGSGGTMKLAEEVHTHTHGRTCQFSARTPFLLCPYHNCFLPALGLGWQPHYTDTAWDGSDSRQGTKGDIGRQ